MKAYQIAGLSFCLFLIACGDGRLREHPFLAMEKLASEGDYESQEKVALSYLEGKGVSQSFTLAKKWFDACSQAKRPRCLYELGRLHEEGRGGPISTTKAGQLYKEGVLAGSPRAMYRLGQFHRLGDGVPKDLARGYAWFSLSAALGFKDAKDALKTMEEECSEVAIGKGKKLAEIWRKNGPDF